MPKETKGDGRELRFEIGVEFIDFLEKIAQTNRYGNSAGDVARRIIQDGLMRYLRNAKKFEAEHQKLKAGEQ